MNNLIRKLEWRIRFVLSSIKRRILNRNNDWIMGRIACMGMDVFKILEIEAEIINMQKGRVDYLNNVIVNKKNKVAANKVIPFINRNDIKYLIFQQQIGYGLKKKPPLMLFMDSYSELTDQRFFNYEKEWSFYANYSDINHSLEFKSKFKAEGLLDQNSLINQYHQFFNYFRNNYGNVPIIFMHFSVKLDSREKFKIRHKKIKEAIEEIKSELQPFYSFTADEEIVDWPEERIPGLENFPYHYNTSTYKNLAKQVEQSGVLKSLKHN
tara:strand:- start:62 stop:862 length:801 start_codon:yes stop_codon:yes gene_type:complete